MPSLRLPRGAYVVLPLLSMGDPRPFGPELFEAPVRLVEPRISVCDLDGDGIEEVLLSGHAGLLLHAARESSGALEYSTLDFPSVVHHAITADLSGDGLEEVVVGGEHLYVLANSGGFDELGPPQIAATGPHDHVAAGDLDADGDLDLIASAGSVLRTYGNLGSAGFELLSEIDDEYLYPGFVTGDWNGDGHMDVARHIGQHVRIRLADGRGGWEAPSDLWAGVFDEPLDAGDVDGDGDLDLLLPGGPQSGGVRLLLGVGDGGFVEGPVVDAHIAGANVLGANLVDVDGDGRCEVLLANSSGCHRIEDPVGAPDVVRWPWAGVFAWAALRGSADSGPDVVGLMETGEATAFHDMWGLALYDARSMHDALWMLDSLPSDAYPSSSHVDIDLNGDGHLDRLTLLGFNGRFVVRLGSVDGWNGGEYGLGFGASLFHVFDADGDGDPDLLCKNYVELELHLVVHVNDGQGHFGPGVPFDPGVSPYSLFGGLGDFDGNGLDDLGASYGSVLTLLLNLGGGRFEIGGSLTDFGLPDEILDLDGDGSLDLVLSGSTQSRIAYGDGKGGIRFVLGGPSVEGLPTRVLAAGDLDLDGRPELVTRIATPSGHRLGIHSSQDGVHWNEPLRLDPKSWVNGGQVADVDGDGLPDLLLRRSGPRTRILRQTSAGTFEPWTNVAWLVSEPLVHDVDGDGLPELIGADGILTRRSR